ncbi:helix-turn-helix transcriptional regulator [Phytohabitans flavus]|uniref:Transcriptional regulator n=1 Tax=Phytohabitans flavus TaxID=1076124 RepID=A0A6F8XWZ8_9ACTN|nr:helix-turn-helix transcriptional regulator [Phytohabitans flavus]BCB78333.1 transcriptional regulator [Phytohabitans flavus]
MIDRAGLAAFLRHRRESLQPEDLNLPRGQRRRTTGLRREEIAALCHISTDYYGRLEQARGPHPSEHVIASIAQGLHLSLDEREHLFHLAGHNPPSRDATNEHISTGLLRVFDQLAGKPAEIVTELGETLLQNDLSLALAGNKRRYAGFARSVGYRWFIEPATRALYEPEDHEGICRVFVWEARKIATLRGPGSKAARLVDLLLSSSHEFATLWHEHEVGVALEHPKRFVHPELGTIALNCQSLIDPLQPHVLIVYTATRGTESHDKVQHLASTAAT